MSGIIGGVLIAAAAIWFIWLLLHQFGSVVPSPPGLPLTGLGQSNSPVPQLSPLAAAGVTLSPASQKPALSQQQALLIASQLEPDAATNARHTTSSYVLVTYPNTATPATHASLQNQPAWLIEYQGVPLAPGDSGASSGSTYTLYVFLDATSGKEILVIRA